MIKPYWIWQVSCSLSLLQFQVVKNLKRTILNQTPSLMSGKLFSVFISTKERQRWIHKRFRVSCSAFSSKQYQINLTRSRSILISGKLSQFLLVQKNDKDVGACIGHQRMAFRTQRSNVLDILAVFHPNVLSSSNIYVTRISIV